LAQVTAKRKQELADQKAGTQADLDTALANLHQAEATITIKDANLEKARLDLEHCGIYSPINGSVILRSVDVGQTVAAAMNAPVLFTIAKDLTDLQIDSAVAEADVGVATVGQTVDFTVDAFPYQTFHGKVGQVRNAASTVQNVVTYDVVITVKNPDLKLLPGMTANIAIVVAHKDDALRVPNAALRFKMPESEPQATPVPVTPRPDRKPPGPRMKNQQRSVFVMPPNGGKPYRVNVKLGMSDGVYTEVTEGLEEGDTVVTSASFATSHSSPSAPNPFGGAAHK
jgi:HlyD family secretion protein